MPALHTTLHTALLPPPTAAVALTATAPDALAVLRRARKKPTQLRVQVLQALMTLDAEHGGANADQLYLHLLQRGAHISVSSIYKVLAELALAQVVDRHRFGQGPATFVLRREQTHLVHFICTQCHAVQGIGSAALKAQVLSAAGIQGFGNDDTTLTLHGRCSACTDSVLHS